MNDDVSDLATRLRVETQVLHIEAERSGYIQEILKRRAGLEGYALFLRNLQPAYEALERALSAHAEHPPLDRFRWPALFRSEAIAGDLTALAGPAWQGALPLLPEGEAYARHIEKVEATDPIRLIGHAYVRYVGDLSGGQIVKTLLSTSPGLTADQLSFYDFPGIADAEAYKNAFRASLDQAGASADHADAIVAEALEAFRLNIDLSIAVDLAMASPDQ